MSGQPDHYDITLSLNREELPDETALIENLILNGNLGTFLYTVANDIVEGRYNLEAGHTRIILNQLIETVSSIFSTVGSMDGNIQDITEVLNDHTGLLSKFNKPTITPTPQPSQEEVAVAEEKTYDIDEVVNLDLGGFSDEDGEDNITVDDSLNDLFDFDIDS